MPESTARTRSTSRSGTTPPGRLTSTRTRRAPTSRSTSSPLRRPAGSRRSRPLDGTTKGTVSLTSSWSTRPWTRTATGITAGRSTCGTRPSPRSSRARSAPSNSPLDPTPSRCSSPAFESSRAPSTARTGSTCTSAIPSAVRSMSRRLRRDRSSPPISTACPVGSPRRTSTSGSTGAYLPMGSSTSSRSMSR